MSEPPADPRGHILPLDNPVLVRWEYASEERLATRNRIYRDLIEGENAEDVVFEAVREAAPGRVLEAGCGQGELAKRIADELGAEVTAVDLSPRMVTLARERGVAADVADVQALPFRTASSTASSRRGSSTTSPTASGRSASWLACCARAAA